MAQRILGLDIGSKNVRIAVLESSLRSVRLVGLDTEKLTVVPPPPRPVPEPNEDGEVEAPDPDEIAAEWAHARRSAARDALEKLKARGSLEADHVVVALPGDRVFTRVLQFPFADPRRIEQVVGFELEEHIPHEIEDVVIDHLVLESGDEGAEVLAAAVPSGEVEDLLDLLAELDVDPRIVSLSTFAYLKLLQASREESGEEARRCVAVVDIGHHRTDVTVMQRGRLAFSRTVRRGGRHLTQSIARALSTDARTAERALISHGRLPCALPAGGGDPEMQGLAAAVAAGLQPILRDVNQTLRSHERVNGEPVEQIVLAGGLARLPGLAETMHSALEVPTAALESLPSDVETEDFPGTDNASAGKPVGLALELVRGGSRQSLNFRRGPFAYKGDFQYLAERAPAIVALAVMLLLAAVGWYWVQRDNLARERDALAENLSAFTKAVVGRAISDPDLAKATIAAPPNKGYVEALPQRTATWVLDRVSVAVEAVRTMPSPLESEVKPGGPPPLVAQGADPDLRIDPDKRYHDVEIERFEIAGAQGEVRGQAKNLESLEMFAQELRETPCLTRVSIENTDKVAFERHRGWLSYEIGFMLSCSAKKKKSKEKDKEKDKEKATGKEGAPAAGEGAAPAPAAPQAAPQPARGPAAPAVEGEGKGEVAP